MTQQPLPMFAPFFDAVREAEKQQKQKREALALLKKHRAEVVAHARGVARQLCERRGVVTSTDVLRVLRADPVWAAQIHGLDARWMGAVFNGSDWQYVRTEPTGSHGRRVTVWAFPDK